MAAKLTDVQEVTRCLWEKPGKCPKGHELAAKTCWEGRQPGWKFYYCPVRGCAHYIGKKKETKK